MAPGLWPALASVLARPGEICGGIVLRSSRVLPFGHLPTLTPREHVVMALVGTGPTNDEIAEHLFTTPFTVGHRPHLPLIAFGGGSPFGPSSKAG
ncbi:LuxR C-terminal-related transcriptional regulator [Streptomyces mirabilis]|uniref:LuxR C-terminal-related transcriptional regulator n=1 Tax=Streptomyces mirabilis TaxID=68239 RepID=UPI003651BEB8